LICKHNLQADLQLKDLRASILNFLCPNYHVLGPNFYPVIMHL